MNTLTFGPHVAAWVSEKIGRKTPWKTDAAIGIVRRGELVGGIVVDDYYPGARCSMHCAGEGKYWLNREFLWTVFDYAFNQLGCKVIFNTAAGRNEESVKFTQHVGFKLLGRVPDGFGDDDMIILTMPKADCRWLELKVRKT